MKFLKFSIFILFLLSFVSAGLSVYLSDIRQNEKEKRMRLEVMVEDLNAIKGRLEADIVRLESDNKDLRIRLETSEEDRLSSVDTIREQGNQIVMLQREVEGYREAFQILRERNHELARVLDGLEVRVSELVLPEIPDEPHVAYVELEMSGVTDEALDADSALGTAAVASRNLSVTPTSVIPKPRRRREVTTEPASVSYGEPEDTSTSYQPAVYQSAGEATSTYEAPAQREEITANLAAQEPVRVNPSEIPSANRVNAVGNIMLVNRNFNFFVSSLGKRHGFDLDDRIIVERGGKQIGKARIEKLYDDYSAAYIIEEQSDQPVQEGDVVRSV